MSKEKPYELYLATVKGTDWPIDGHRLTFGLWDYDKRSCYHLYGWDDADDEAVMQTMFQSMVEVGMEDADNYAEFVKAWEDGEFDAPGVFCIGLDQVENVEKVE